MVAYVLHVSPIRLVSSGKEQQSNVKWSRQGLGSLSAP